MKITGGILAGGEGRRFGGADKGLVPWRGRPLLEHVLERLTPQVDALLISANRNLEEYGSYGVPVVSDAIPGRGPLGGLLALLEACRTGWLLCVPCDAVTLPRGLAHALRDAAWSEQAELAVLRDASGMHPTCCLVSTSLSVDLRAFLDRGGTTMRVWQARHRFAWAETAEPWPNVNDPEGLAQLEQGA